MQNIEIKNPEFKKLLSECEWFATDSFARDHVHMVGSNFSREQALDYVSHDYMQKIIDYSVSHDGYPDTMKGYSFNTSRVKYKGNDLRAHNHITKKHDYLIDKFKENYSVRNNALFTLYPPGGFISWHNNANASAYNIILTWSENGNGYFEYFDMNTKKVVRLQDKPGWQCKCSYFGDYSDPKTELVYHAAYTDCYRMTISFTFDRTVSSQLIQSMFIEEIQSEE